jgi:type IV secretory pathway VirB4 component
MGLNNRQIDIIATATPKRQYYYVSEKGRRLYDLALGPLALAFVGASDKDSIAAIQALEAKFGNEWVSEWLKSRNINFSDYVEEYAA